MKRCARCGEKYEEADVCPQCGIQIDDISAVSKPPVVIYIILSIVAIAVCLTFAGIIYQIEVSFSDIDKNSGNKQLSENTKENSPNYIAKKNKTNSGEKADIETHTDAKKKRKSKAEVGEPEEAVPIDEPTPKNPLVDAYIIPNSDVEYLTDSDVSGLNLQEINYAKNEIYARHGRKFESQELDDYFSSKSWYEGIYEPGDFDENYSQTALSDCEKKNAKMLSDIEHSMNPKGYELDK